MVCLKPPRDDMCAGSSNVRTALPTRLLQHRFCPIIAGRIFTSGMIIRRKMDRKLPTHQLNSVLEESGLRHTFRTCSPYPPSFPAELTFHLFHIIRCFLQHVLSASLERRPLFLDRQPSGLVGTHVLTDDQRAGIEPRDRLVSVIFATGSRGCGSREGHTG